MKLYVIVVLAILLSISCTHQEKQYNIFINNNLDSLANIQIAYQFQEDYKKYDIFTLGAINKNTNKKREIDYDEVNRDDKEFRYSFDLLPNEIVNIDSGYFGGPNNVKSLLSKYKYFKINQNSISSIYEDETLRKSIMIKKEGERIWKYENTVTTVIHVYSLTLNTKSD